nr:MAG TPA: hypothetical protein [Caudoviricetes sp.]
MLYRTYVRHIREIFCVYIFMIKFFFLFSFFVLFNERKFVRLRLYYQLCLLNEKTLYGRKN